MSKIALRVGVGARSVRSSVLEMRFDEFDVSHVCMYILTLRMYKLGSWVAWSNTREKEKQAKTENKEETATSNFDDIL